MQTTLDDPRLKKPLFQLHATYAAYKHQASKEIENQSKLFEILLKAVYVAAKCAGPQEFARYVEGEKLKVYRDEITPETFENELEEQKKRMPVLYAVMEKKEDFVPKIDLGKLGIIKRKG